MKKLIVKSGKWHHKLVTLFGEKVPASSCAYMGMVILNGVYFLAALAVGIVISSALVFTFFSASINTGEWLVTKGPFRPLSVVETCRYEGKSCNLVVEMDGYRMSAGDIVKEQIAGEEWLERREALKVEPKVEEFHEEENNWRSSYDEALREKYQAKMITNEVNNFSFLAAIAGLLLIILIVTAISMVLPGYERNRLEFNFFIALFLSSLFVLANLVADFGIYFLSDDLSRAASHENEFSYFLTPLATTVMLGIFTAIFSVVCKFFEKGYRYCGPRIIEYRPDILAHSMPVAVAMTVLGGMLANWIFPGDVVWWMVLLGFVLVYFVCVGIATLSVIFYQAFKNYRQMKQNIESGDGDIEEDMVIETVSDVMYNAIKSRKSKICLQVEVV